jgi:hypothetical protein
VANHPASIDLEHELARDSSTRADNRRHRRLSDCMEKAGVDSEQSGRGHRELRLKQENSAGV